MWSVHASKHTSIHTHARNEVTLVWGSLRLAPITHVAFLGPTQKLSPSSCRLGLACLPKTIRCSGMVDQSFRDYFVMLVGIPPPFPSASHFITIELSHFFVTRTVTVQLSIYPGHRYNMYNIVGHAAYVILMWCFSLSRVKFKCSLENFMYYCTPLPVASLKQLLSFL